MWLIFKGNYNKEERKKVVSKKKKKPMNYQCIVRWVYESMSVRKNRKDQDTEKNWTLWCNSFFKKLPLFFKAVSENQSNRVRMTEVFYITYPAFSVSFQFETRLCIILQEEMQHCARDEMVSRLHFWVLNANTQIRLRSDADRQTGSRGWEANSSIDALLQ